MDENFIGPIKHRRGDVRADGLLFWTYEGARAVWYSPIEFEGVLEHLRRQQRKSYERDRALYLERSHRRYHSNKTQLLREQRDRYYAAHERNLATRRRYRLANIDKVRAHSNEWRRNNLEQARAVVRKYHRDHRESLRKMAKQRRLAFPHLATEWGRRRKAAQKAAVPENFNAKRTSMIYAWAKRVQKCLGIEMHVDHILPLAKGGKHNYDNLQVLPAQLNMRKQDNEKYELPGDWRRPPQSA